MEKNESKQDRQNHLMSSMSEGGEHIVFESHGFHVKT
jgi:hypothetical protein